MSGTPVKRSAVARPWRRRRAARSWGPSEIYDRLEAHRPRPAFRTSRSPNTRPPRTSRPRPCPLRASRVPIPRGSEGGKGQGGFGLRPSRRGPGSRGPRRCSPGRVDHRHMRGTRYSRRLRPRRHGGMLPCGFGPALVEFAGMKQHRQSKRGQIFRAIERLEDAGTFELRRTPHIRVRRGAGSGESSASRNHWSQALAVPCEIARHPVALERGLDSPGVP